MKLICLYKLKPASIFCLNYTLAAEAPDIAQAGTKFGDVLDLYIDHYKPKKPPLRFAPLKYWIKYLFSPKNRVILKKDL